ncbi:hypothetical protein BAY61_05220 [Prauserella marina]|uniref:Uncharacterized protein n=1 Tax=Prauserella marina TaxID=530584 RepID=A0A222VKN5_9PSEU|nr:hypothetical protein [Prauserella marina]ASR34488.1 hypothetical protein BAY61_05220 [Prauserella marina]PWV85914.1 hypothetical protein DES30_1011944 [Prauserella marina]SDC42443.1 hypothetical protein SAMN05421630_10248 [Prauserella marina]
MSDDSADHERTDPAETPNTPGTTEKPLAESERAELEWLRRENVLLRTQRTILERVAAGFAEDANATLLRRNTPGTPFDEEK